MDEESGPQPGAWRDRAGYLWLESSPGRVFCYDDTARRRMGDKWPAMALEDAGEEFGPLVPLAPVPEGDGDRIVFLYSLGRSVEVPPGFNGLTAEGLEDGQFEELVPGYQVLLLSMGAMWVSDREYVNGAFVVIRKNGEWLHGRVETSEDTRRCRSCGHERRLHDHYTTSTYCSRCGCGRWRGERRWNTGFIAILIEIDTPPGGHVKKTAVARAWAVELWLNALCAPWRVLPHLHRPRWWQAGGEYACERCGSSSARVQRKGQRQALSLRGRLS